MDCMSQNMQVTTAFTKVEKEAKLQSDPYLPRVIRNKQNIGYNVASMLKGNDEIIKIMSGQQDYKNIKIKKTKSTFQN